jgi:hypothetical protein
MLKRHISIGVFVVYIDTGSPVPNIPSKSRDLADENNKMLTEWKWFETTVISDDNARLWVRWTNNMELFIDHTYKVKRLCIENADDTKNVFLSSE